MDIYHPTNYRKNLITFWRQFFPNWDIPNGFHVHHIVPKHLAKKLGWDKSKLNHPKNLIALHPDDHVSIHLNRGDKILRNGFILSIRTGKDNSSNKPEVKTKIKNKLLGRKFTQQHKEKLKEAALKWHKNHPNHFVGRTLSEDTKAKIKEARKHQSPMSQEGRNKLSEWNKTRKNNPFNLPWKELVKNKYEELCKLRSFNITGENNPMKKKAGTFFLITDGSNTKQHPKHLPIPDGWRKGRHYNPKSTDNQLAEEAHRIY